ncbi:docking protein 3 [Varanus komodoensis]|uniref:docking protein 3 n=1 Tax=Varanus komodoensis TaxID=61221 RepID=UPI001CF7C754|nr:docking protein 3 [Varanus komodoensis]
MEHPVKEGILYVQHPKFGKKTWRKVWAQLFPDSPSGVARLEYFEGVAMEKASLRKGERKVIRLSSCVSVKRVGEHSSPKDTAPFCLCLMERNCLLAADHPDDWIEYICQLAFQRTPAPASTTTNTRNPQPLMEENAIYSSWQEMCEFPVSIFPTEASARCNLKGNYLMAPLLEQLVLKDTQSGHVLYSWPYAFLRRFGQEKTVFSFEAGRRCDSGEGLFTFSTARATEICKAVSAAIEHQKNILLERDKKTGIYLAEDCIQKAGPWQWPTSMGSQEEMQPLYARPPKEAVGTGFPLLHASDSGLTSPETGAPETPIIYASIGKSFPLFQPSGKVETVPKEQGEPLSDHLYENLRALEQRPLCLGSLGFSYRDSPEGSSSEPSPIYDNSLVATKCSSSHSNLNHSAGPDSYLESQCPPRPLDCQEAACGGEGNAKPKVRGAGAFKHKLVSMLSREGGVKATSKNAGSMDKS